MKQTAILLVFLLILPFVQPVQAQAQTPSVLVLEAATGCVLSEENADTRRPVGTLAKLMTAYLTAREILSGSLSPDTVLTAGECVQGMRGAVIWLVPGDRVTVDDLLMGLLCGNANDAAAVLAEAVSGSSERFVMDMNAAAFDLGMRDTRFTSAQGFDDPQAYSTARDIGRLACAVLQADVLTPYLTTWRTVIREDATPAELVNENTLTRTLDGCRGLKAAHSEAAGCCLAAAAEREGLLVCVIILGETDPDERFAQARQHIRSAFSTYKVMTPGFAEEFLLPVSVRGGTASAVQIALDRLPLLAVPGASQIDCVTVMPDYLTAPLKAGTPVGRVYFYQEDTLLAESALLAAESVPRMGFRYALGNAFASLFREGNDTL